MQDNWEWLTDHIPKGQRNAISADELSSILVQEDKRDLRKHIENARRAGIPICGDSHGYYFAASDEETAAYIRIVRSRIRTSCICLAPFLRMIRTSEGGACG